MKGGNVITKENPQDEDEDVWNFRLQSICISFISLKLMMVGLMQTVQIFSTNHKHHFLFFIKRGESERKVSLFYGEV